jgi:putative ABC transport system permease protein
VLLFALPGGLLLGCIVLLVAWMTLTHIGQQTWSVARVGIATLPQRFGATAVVVVGIAGVVGVLVALLAMGAGFEATLGRPARTIMRLSCRLGANGTQLGSHSRNCCLGVPGAAGPQEC